MSATPSPRTGTQALSRVLGRWDLVLLFVVAITNLNVVPVVAASGVATLWLWILALLFFFWPQGVAVIELTERYPGEGGIYLWTKNLFGDFHGFLSGWCYWTNNVFYVPTVLLYMVGIGVYVGGPRTIGLGENRLFIFIASLGLLWVLAALNVRGLRLGKWVNNAGGLGTALAAAVLIGLAAFVVHARGTHLTGSILSFHSLDWRLMSTFGVICFGLVGLELGSTMGDEIRDPRRTVPPAVILGGIICGLLYVGATLAVLLTVPREEVGVVQGILQAVSRMAAESGMSWLVPLLALLLTVSTAGIASAWFSGSARVPFVAGLDHYLPAGLGKIHPRNRTPYIALLVHAGLSSIFLAMSFVGATVGEAYLTMLDLAVVLQLIPFLYMFWGVLRLASHPGEAAGAYSSRTLWVSGTCGLLATAFGTGLAFVPSHKIVSVGLFELKMWVGVGLFVGAASVFFGINARRKVRENPCPVDIGSAGNPPR